MKRKGLKDTTDAMSHCKSMYAKGGSNSKTHMMRSMGSYETGGTTGLQMGESADLGRKIRKVVRKVKNAFKNSGGGHTPTYHKPKCGGVGCYN
jgi:hypothetical protein